MLATTREELFSDLCNHAREQRREKINSEISAAATVEDRFSILVILLYPKNYGRYKAIHWNHVVFGRQRLTSVMIQAFGKRWPEHVLWMVTGLKGEGIMHGHPSHLIDHYLGMCEKPILKRFF